MNHRIAPAGNPEISAAEALQLIQGDLESLTPEQKLRHLVAVAEAVGVNPITKPFQYITVFGNGKKRTILYATKDCTEQLRALRNIDLTIVARETVKDCYVVTARAKLPTGRTDESIGAVPIAGASGEALANALMKAETKSKRRVTLSICGLGILDETEIETIPGAQLAGDGAPAPRPAAPQPQIETEPEPPEPAEAVAMSFKLMVESISAFREPLGEVTYYTVLGQYGVKHSNQFRPNEKRAAECFRFLRRLVRIENYQERIGADAWLAAMRSLGYEHGVASIPSFDAAGEVIQAMQEIEAGQ